MCLLKSWTLLLVACHLAAPGLHAQTMSLGPCAADPPVLQGGALASGRAGAASLTVASLNMAREARAERILSEWQAVETIGGADVLLLQEFVHSRNGDETLLPALSGRLNHYFAYAPTDRLDNGDIQGLAILSRYPLSDVRVVPLQYFPLHFRARCRIALAATVETGAGPVRVVNLHLDSRINARDRLEQLRPVREAVRAFAGPQIVGGDFNTNRMFWLNSFLPVPFVHGQSRPVQEAMAAEGFHTPMTATPATIRILGIPMFKLDWLFVKGVEAVGAGVSRIRFSDHNGVWVRLRLPASPAANSVSR